MIKFQDYEKEFEQIGITNKNEGEAILQYMQFLALCGIEHLNQKKND